MIIVDNALRKREEENNPIKVGIVGAGFMAKGIVLQVQLYVPGMEIVAIANRTLENAAKAYTQAGINNIKVVNNKKALEDNIRQKKYSITDDPFILCEAEGIDVIVEVTGAVEYSTHVIMKAIENGKHIVIMNAEVHGTIGPILKVYADKAGVVFSDADGDQPGVEMNLYRFVKSIGVKPVLCGNIKGLHDPYRNPTTQEGFAKKWGMVPSMVTSFADGTKISFEQAIVANATGMKVGKLGMHGPTVPTGTPLKDVVHNLYPPEELLNGSGIVDYVVGAEPAPGVFVLGIHDHPVQKHYLNLYKLGEGPFYLFYTPYHLCHFEVPSTIARAVLFHDATIAPLGKPFVDVVTTAKTDLKKGEIIDGLGEYKTYGLCENIEISTRKKLLPIGLAKGCKLINNIPKDGLISYDDVEIPKGRLSDKMREEQNKYFGIE